MTSDDTWQQPAWLSDWKPSSALRSTEPADNEPGPGSAGSSGAVATPQASAADAPGAPFGLTPQPIGDPVETPRWPVRDWDRSADSRTGGSVTPGLTATSRKAQAQGSWPATPMAPASASLQARPVQGAASASGGAPGKKKTDLTVLAVVVSLISVGLVLATVLDGADFNPIPEVIAIFLWAGLAHRKDNRRMRVMGVIGIIVMIAAIVVGAGFS